MHQLFHTTFGFCIWDAAAAALVVALVVMLVLNAVRQKRRLDEMASELSEKMALETLPALEEDDL